MKKWGTIGTILLLCLALVSTISCGGGKEEITQQLIEVVRGDLIVSVSGSGNIEVSNEAKLAFGSGGRVDKMLISEGDDVSEGDMLAKLDTDALELALTQSRTAYLQAKAVRDQAKVDTDRAKATRDQAKVTRDQAETSLEQAEYNLELLELWSTQSQIDIAALQVEAAESQLEAAESQLEVAESQIEVAELQYTVAELQVKSAKQSVDYARKQLDEATIHAPFGGVVASVDADEGDSVLATMTIVHLIDPDTMELEVEVDEIDIAEVKPGQRAIIEVDALPDLLLEGEITSISTLSKEMGGLVLYEVTIGFNVPPDSGLKLGMSAIADIILQERSNVLLVPNRALTQDSQGNPVVKVMVNEEIEERPVVTGISDGFDTEIVSGLNEGDVTVIETKVKPSAPGLF